MTLIWTYLRRKTVAYVQILEHRHKETPRILGLSVQFSDGGRVLVVAALGFLFSIVI